MPKTPDPIEQARADAALIYEKFSGFANDEMLAAIQRISVTINHVSQYGWKPVEKEKVSV